MIRPWRRISLLQVTCGFAWALCVVTSMAAADPHARTTEDLWLNFGRFGVLFALILTVAWRWRELGEVVHDAFVRAHAHHFVKGLLVLIVLFIVVMLVVLKRTNWAIIVAPALIFAQAVLALFVPAGRGFDRVAMLGVWMVFVQGATGSPRDFEYGAAFFAVAVPGYVTSHFHALMKRHDAEERQPVAGALGAGLVFAALVLSVYVGLYGAVPRLYGLTHDYDDPTVRRQPGGLPIAPANEPAPEGDDGSLVRTILNGATMLGGAVLVLALLRAVRKRGPGDAVEEEARVEVAETVVEDLPQEVAVKRRKTWIKTPRALVILYYNSLPERLKPFGVQRFPHQTPAEFADAVVAARPETAQSVDRLTRAFRRAKYSLDFVSKQDVDDSAAMVTAIAEVFERSAR